MNFTLKKSDLNFKVYTVPSKPTTAGIENDIAIISSVPMTNWIMSPDKPSGVPRNYGDVWIQYSTSGDTRNILKQNTLMIATISAWQYVDGAWTSVEAVSYQGGVWVDWVTYLFNNGNQCVDITGGWSADGASWNGNQKSTIVVQGDAIYIEPKQYAVLATNKPLDTAKYKSLKVVGKCLTNLDYAFGIYLCSSRAGTSDNKVSELYFNGETTITEKTLDLSSINNGEYYILIAVTGGTFVGGYVYDIWVE